MTYISYFKLKFKAGLQYKAAAIAGILTQLFFGLVYASVYIAFYESNPSSNAIPLDQLITYVWLGQSLFSLIYMWQKDKEILNLIKTGNIAYELIRPQDLYMMWFSKIYGEKLSNVILRFLPVIIFSLLLPYPFKINLSITPLRLLLFIISIVLASILVTVIILLYHIIVLFTLDEKGIVNIFMIVSDIFSGLVVPLALFPKFLEKIAISFPFAYVSDFPFRLYVGNYSITYGIKGIFIQLFWIITLVIIGRLLMKKAQKKAVIQGG